MEELTLKTVLFTWNLSDPTTVVLLFTTIFYVVGWRDLRSRGYHKLATKWRLTSYLAGQIVLVIALLSAIDVLQEYFFFVHMIQHLLLLMLAPILLWLGNPYPIALWGIPRYWRIQIGALLNREAASRRVITTASRVGTIWLVYVCTTYIWHDPVAYQAAIANELIHYAEHLTFFLSGVLFWWHIIGAAPRFHKQLAYGARIALLLLSMAANQLIAVPFAMSEEVIYPHYLEVPRLLAMSAQTDQAVAGAIMWIPGGMMYALAALLLFVKMASEE